MQLLCRNANFCPKAEFKAICKAGGSIDINGSSVHRIGKLLRGRIGFRDNTFRMSGVIAVDMCDGVFDAINDLD